MAQNVTISQVATHAKKHVQTVKRAFKTANVETFRPPASKQKVARLSDVNKFLRESWPQIGEMRIGHN